MGSNIIDKEDDPCVKLYGETDVNVESTFLIWEENFDLESANLLKVELV